MSVLMMVVSGGLYAQSLREFESRNKSKVDHAGDVINRYGPKGSAKAKNNNLSDDKLELPDYNTEAKTSNTFRPAARKENVRERTDTRRQVNHNQSYNEDVDIFDEIEGASMTVDEYTKWEQQEEMKKMNEAVERLINTPSHFSDTLVRVMGYDAHAWAVSLLRGEAPGDGDLKIIINSEPFLRHANTVIDQMERAHKVCMERIMVLSGERTELRKSISAGMKAMLNTDYAKKNGLNEENLGRIIRTRAAGKDSPDRPVLNEFDKMLDEAVETQRKHDEVDKELKSKEEEKRGWMSDLAKVKGECAGGAC